MADGTPTSYAEMIKVLDNLPLLCRENRRRIGLSLRAAAQEIGISFATVARIEHGEDGSLSNARKVLAWLGGQPYPGAMPRGYKKAALTNPEETNHV